MFYSHSFLAILLARQEISSLTHCPAKLNDTQVPFYQVVQQYQQESLPTDFVLKNLALCAAYLHLKLDNYQVAFYLD
jgi:hypothetical protein